MAQKVLVQITDDLTGEEGAEPVFFTYGGVEYEIDLSDANQEALHQALEPYLAAARPFTQKNKKKVSGKKKPIAVVSDVDPAEIRAWAVENGYEINERGRIPKAVVDAYNAS